MAALPLGGEEWGSKIRAAAACSPVSETVRLRTTCAAGDDPAPPVAVDGVGTASGARAAAVCFTSAPDVEDEDPPALRTPGSSAMDTWVSISAAPCPNFVTSLGELDIPDAVHARRDGYQRQSKHIP